MNVKGAAALVAGGSSGLGWAAALALREAGCGVVVLDVKPPMDGNVTAWDDSELRFVEGDVRSRDSIIEALDLAKSEMGDLRVAVNAAGIGTARRLFSTNGTHTTEEFARTLDINLTGTFNVMIHAAEYMRELDPVDGERGVIINTASVAAFGGQVGQVSYASSKAGIVGLTLPAARDLGRDGIRVLAIAPGAFDTDMFDGLRGDVRELILDAVAFPKRLGKPEEFGAAVLHLVDNVMFNGTTVHLDAGLRL